MLNTDSTLNIEMNIFQCLFLFFSSKWGFIMMIHPLLMYLRQQKVAKVLIKMRFRGVVMEEEVPKL